MCCYWCAGPSAAPAGVEGDGSEPAAGAATEVLPDPFRSSMPQSVPEIWREYTVGVGVPGTPDFMPPIKQLQLERFKSNKANAWCGAEYYHNRAGGIQVCIAAVCLARSPPEAVT